MKLLTGGPGPSRQLALRSTYTWLYRNDREFKIVTPLKTSVSTNHKSRR